MNWVFGAGLILLALAAAADFLGGRVMRAGPLYLLGAAGSGCLAATGGFALTGHLVTLGIGGLARRPAPWPADGRAGRRPAVRAVPYHGVRRGAARLGGLR